LKARVTRHLEGWSCEILRRDGHVVHKQWVEEVPRYVNFTTIYRSSEWDGRIFRIRERLGDIACEIDVSEFLV
jgi:hypothetical protein